MHPQGITQERSFDLLIVLFTFVLPQITAFVLETMKKLDVSNVTIPTDAASVTQLDNFSMTVMGLVLFILFVITVIIGQLWDREWWKYGVFYWGIFTILYTTVFTNVSGFFTGVVGSLGYWLVQHGVERGSQPTYYYWLIQIPMYEYLPAIGTVQGVATCADCHGCHTVLPSDDAASPVNEANILTTCRQCHEDTAKHFHKVDGITDPRTSEPVSCVSCHLPDSSDEKSLLAYEGTRELCIQCHDPSMGRPWR